MIYKIETARDEKVEAVYEEAMADLGKFYGIDWTKGRPKIAIVKDRQTINELLGKETEPWVVGFVGRVNLPAIFMLDKDSYEAESNHKYDEKEYLMTVKHELSHLFYSVLVGNNKGNPTWLWEGVAIYTSGQDQFKTRPKELKDFLGFYDTRGAGVYRESGFAIEALVNKFGKEKLLDLIKATKEADTKEKFESKFKELYGFLPDYNQFNELM